MQIVILPGLDGNGVLSQNLQVALGGQPRAKALSYPSDLHRYDDIYEWVTTKLPSEDFILVAQSFSGPVAARVGADKHPRLRGIVFVATFARAPVRLPGVLAKVVPFKVPILIRLAQLLLMGSWASPVFTKTFLAALDGVSKATLAGRLEEVARVDVTPLLARIEVPFVYLRARQDRLVPRRMSLDFQRVGGRVNEMDGPHFLLQARADEAARHISEFITQLD